MLKSSVVRLIIHGVSRKTDATKKKEDKQDKYDRHRDTHADHYAVLQDENVLEIHLKCQSFISILIKG